MALAGTTLLSLSGAIVPVAQAQSVAELQAQINALLATISQLQTQLSAVQGGGAAPATSFTRDLTVGSTGADVKALQQWLNGQGYRIAASGAGSMGNESEYFGSLTKAALAKWQAAMSISPAVGYFGPITRARVASTAGGAPAAPGAPQLPAPASGLRVGLAADNPAAGSIISGTSAAAARVPVLAVNLTAGAASGITVNELRFKKIGVLSDSSVSGAYVVENGQVLAQYNSISGGVVVFSGLGLNIAAGQTKRIELAIDPATGLSAGNTVGFGMNAAADVVAVDASGNAVSASGAFPLSGNTFTVTTVSNPSLASMTVASSSIGTEVTAGTNNNLVGAWSFTVSNSKVWLKALKLKVIGSANKSDIRNVVLKVNGTQVGPTLAQVSSGGEAAFDASANPGALNTGANNIQVSADIAGSPSFNFQFEILNSYDILAVDSQYNVPISGSSNTGTQVSIKTGSVTVSQSTDTPTGNIAAGQSSVTLAKFSVYAGGEAVRMKWIGVGLNITGGVAATIDHYFTNLALTDDAGGQVGSTINTLSTTVTCNGGASFTNSTSSYRNCFGNTSSPINYVIPANTTRVLSLKADVANVSSTNFTSVVGLTQDGTANLQGLTSAQTSNMTGVSGAARTLASASLTTAKSSALGDQTLAKNAAGLKIGSYALSASSAEGVTVNNLSVIANGAIWSNLRLKIDGVQFGSTQGTVSSGTTYSFSGTPFSVPAGQTKYVDVYADSLSSASGAVSPASQLAGCSATGGASLSALSCTARTGQNITFADQSGITVALDSSNPAAKQLVMGSTGQVLGIFRFTETTNIEDVKVTDLYFFDLVNATSVKAAFGNVGVYNSAGSLLASAGAATTYASTSNPGAGFYYKFSFASPVIVPRANSISLTLKGDVSSYSSSGATDNTSHAFRVSIAQADTAVDTIGEVVVALGATSNSSSSVATSSPNANAVTLLRSKLTVSASGLGSTSGRARSSVDDLASISFAADSAGGVQVSSVTITFSGSGPSNTNFFNTSPSPDSSAAACATCYVTLYDSASGKSYWAVASNTTDKTLSYDLQNYQVSGGSSKSFTLRANTAQSGVLHAAVASISQALSATIQIATSTVWKSALDNAASTGLGLESYILPIQIQSVSYAAGT